jgi:hypothetical protein
MFLEHVQRPGVSSHLYEFGLTGAIGNRQQDLTDIFSERTCIRWCTAGLDFAMAIKLSEIQYISASYERRWSCPRFFLVIRCCGTETALCRVSVSAGTSQKVKIICPKFDPEKPMSSKSRHVQMLYEALSLRIDSYYVPPHEQLTRADLKLKESISQDNLLLLAKTDLMQPMRKDSTCLQGAMQGCGC